MLIKRIIKEKIVTLLLYKSISTPNTLQFNFSFKILIILNIYLIKLIFNSLVFYLTYWNDYSIKMQKIYMLTFILQIVSNSFSCEINNCEICSPSSSLICINCETGYRRSLELGCYEDASKTSEIIENCELASGLDCIICHDSFELISGRCYPKCYEDCVCFYPLKCLIDFPLDLKNKTENSSNASKVNCSKNCKECTIEKFCSVCNDGFLVDSEKNCKNILNFKNDIDQNGKQKIKILLLHSSGIGPIAGGFVIALIIA